MTRLFVILATILATATPGQAASLKLADSFRIGSTGVLCTAQSRVADPALTTMFDRGYRIVCRDAAAPVGKLFALRTSGADRATPLVANRSDGAVCAAPVAAGIAALPGAMLAKCQNDGLAVSVYTLVRGNTLYVAEGLSGYGSALRLGLQSLVADSGVAGEVEVAATEAGDPAAFARVQAGNLDPGQALAEAYVRNNVGSFAEASEFFDLLVERNRQGSPGFNRSAEYLANQGLQQSNLGNFAEADALLRRAGAAIDPADPVVTRLYRNVRAIHELNRHRPETTLVELQRIVVADTAGLATDRVAGGFIDVPLAQKLNADDDALRGLAGVDSRITPAERAAVLDGQALYLRGAAERMMGDDAKARASLAAATAQLGSIREGRVASIGWLRAGIAGETAILQERAGRGDDARASLMMASEIFQTQYPGSAAGLVAKARLAALLARQGRADEAVALYREVIAAADRKSVV